MFTDTRMAKAFPTGVWPTRESAEAWIRRVQAEGVLSAYVLGESAYESNVRLGMLKLDLGKQDRKAPEFERVFTTAVEHFHYGPSEAVR